MISGSSHLRGLGVSIAVLVAGCKFSGPSVAGDGPAGDGASDAMRDAARDAGPLDAPGPARKKRITIDPTKVTGDQATFPVWIALTDADLAARAGMNGSDIYFTRPDGTLLEHELQHWTKGTGRLEAWVRIDLADTTPTLLDLRYGDPDATHAPNPLLVFSSSFAAVWHLDDSLMNATIADARNARNGTAVGLGTGDRVPARLGGGIDFDDNDDRIEFVNPYMGNGPHTISAWVDEKNSNDCDSIVTVGTAAENTSRWVHANHQTNQQAGVGFYANDWFNPPNMNLKNAGWVLVHWVFQGDESRVYRDGALVGTRQHAGGIDTQGMAGYIGYAPVGWGDCGLDGALDEVRLATVTRSAGWIATEFANQSSPATFYSVGAEEFVP